MRIFFYGLVRVVLFVALWALFYYVMDLWMIFAVIAAAILAFAVSYLFLDRLRTGATEDLSAAWEGRPGRRGRTETADADAEDAYTEGRFRE
ncbi:MULTISPECIES: DUF4229 domain-containing protein [Micrococcus]|uniref:DUF4229 domain-containing protein n=1 Tax=Micrococcus TaxID=1269 RepID=UPI00098EA8F5|nr:MULTISPECIES: DUF4229 domain-containing protein [Micrococcus]MCT1760541.1 DUF4229 domain-containing protein [Micrococcus luteus]MCV7614408.1 DUF4229 domain-containing protein [Micrococcus luteus]MCV7646945.1 DUF4229 domain-containing protein [Micrococcus luteus]MCV7725087.1 DUF4229 domain-containing protein [Micrococcus luteus]QDW17991.1 DUF4229 domain-containing protein [Micrococcus sp. KBS0714]